MNLSEFFHREQHPALKWLGHKDWLIINQSEGGMTYRINSNARSLVSDYEPAHEFGPQLVSEAKELLQGYASSGTASAFFMQTFCKALASGPKLFIPTVDQCLAFENTSVNIPFEDYEQPFPATIVEIPYEFKGYIKQKYKVKNAPRYVFAYKHDSGIISASAWYDRNNIICNVLSPRPIYKTIEDAIVTNKGNAWVEEMGGGSSVTKPDEDFDVAELTQRLALNFSLGMTMLGVKTEGPLNKAAYHKHKRTLANKKANEKKKARAKSFMIAPVFVVTFAQEIEFFERQEEHPAQNQGGTHKSPKPHWRKGHFRKQAYGEGLSKRKLVFIKPIMVMKHLFVGDLADTSTIYRGRK